MPRKGELLITILSSLAQEESRNISENVTWAYQKKFQQGKVVVNAKRFLGFDKDENGDLIINEQQAELVRRIYHEFEDGFTETMIAHRLNSDMVPGIFGKPSWDGGIIAQILTNEKYKGDLLLQKTYVPDYLKKRSVPNNGQREQYYIKNDHEAIIPRDEWEAVQLERARRAAFKKEHDVPYIRFGVDTINPFAAKIICGYCGDVYKVLTGDQYKCRRRIRSGGRECKAPIIHLRDIELGFCEAWKKLMQKKLREKWNGMIENGNPLEKLRGRQFLSLADQCITEYSPELALKVLERVELHWCSDIIKYVFYDGSEVTVQVEAKREN